MTRLIDPANPHENWFHALHVWNHVANWQSRRTSNLELKNQIKTLLVLLWNEKDWLKKEYPAKTKEIEAFVDASKHLKIVGDFANASKHRGASRHSRSAAAELPSRSRTFSGGSSRQLFFIAVSKNETAEVFPVLRGAIDELSGLRLSLGLAKNESAL